MKSSTSLLTYFSALVIGILLIVFRQSADLREGIVIAMGILILIPSVIVLLSSFVRKKESGTARPWYITTVSIAGIVLGAWMLFMPGFFIGAIVYTLGVILVLVGLAQLTFIAAASGSAGALMGWYIMPALTVAGGLIVIFLGPAVMSACVGLVAGIILICYAVNGFACINRESKPIKKIENQI